MVLSRHEEAVRDEHHELVRVVSEGGDLIWPGIVAAYCRLFGVVVVRELSDTAFTKE